MKAPELIVIGIDGGVGTYIAKKAAEGKLPNFAKMLARGCRLADLRPPHPTITPVCWSAFQTGATPEINGIVADKLHLGGHLEDLVSGYHGSNLQAERFWEAASRGGKSCIVDCLPVSGPARREDVWQLEGTTGNPGRMIMPDGTTEYVDVPQQIWFFDKNKNIKSALKDITIPPSPIREIGNGKYQLGVNMESRDANRHNLDPISWNLNVSDNGFTLLFDDRELELAPGKWVTFERLLPKADGALPLAFRFILHELEDGFAVFASAACYINDRAFPEAFSKLFDHMPPTPVHREYLFYTNPATHKLTMDSWSFHLDWHIEMFKRALAVKDFDVIVTYIGDTDTVNHFFWPILSGKIPADEEMRRYVERCFEEIYEEMDRYVGFFMEHVADENTTFLLVSDHGSLGVVEERNADHALEAAGLLTYLDAEKRQIDWSVTKAAVRGCCNVFINLQGRETDGIVPPEEYEKTVDEVITALQNNMRGPQGESYLAFAVRKREAGFFGLGGDRCGDVVFGLSAGYAAMTVHAEQIPTATSDYGSMRALGILAGPGIPENTVWEKPVNIIDLAPTLCARLGTPLPEHSNGRIIQEFLPGK